MSEMDNTDELVNRGVRFSIKLLKLNLSLRKPEDKRNVRKRSFFIKLVLIDYYFFLHIFSFLLKTLLEKK